jgi:hypothetical protein
VVPSHLRLALDELNRKDGLCNAGNPASSSFVATILSLLFGVRGEDLVRSTGPASGLLVRRNHPPTVRRFSFPNTYCYKSITLFLSNKKARRAGSSNCILRTKLAGPFGQSRRGAPGRSSGS